VPVVVSGSNQLGGTKKNKVLMADMSSLNANSKLEILSTPPAMNGKLPKVTAGQGLPGGKPVSAAPGTATAVLQAGGIAVVPTAPSAAHVGSTIVYDPVEHRFVNANPAPNAPAAPSTTPSTMKTIENGATNGVPVAPSSVAQMPNHPPNSLPPSATAHVFTTPPARSVPPQPPRILTSPSMHTNAPSRSFSTPASSPPHASAPAPHASGGGHPH
jgi:hypothetical protein